jgi:hypothetical protein
VNLNDNFQKNVNTINNSDTLQAISEVKRNDNNDQKNDVKNQYLNSNNTENNIDDNIPLSNVTDSSKEEDNENYYDEDFETELPDGDKNNFSDNPQIKSLQAQSNKNLNSKKSINYNSYKSDFENYEEEEEVIDERNSFSKKEFLFVQQQINNEHGKEENNLGNNYVVKSKQETKGNEQNNMFDKTNKTDTYESDEFEFD